MDTRKKIIIAIVIIAALVGAYFLLSAPKEEEAAKTTAPGAAAGAAGAALGASAKPITSPQPSVGLNAMTKTLPTSYRPGVGLTEAQILTLQNP
jgi:hypothetical protein